MCTPHTRASGPAAERLAGEGADSGRSPARASRAGAPIDGISCEAETLNYHIHAHLTLYENGRAVPVPTYVGIPYSQAISGPHYCLYWLHTHDTSGVIHIESPTPRFYTLVQFFDIWHNTSLWDAQGGLATPAGLVVDSSFVNALSSARPSDIHAFVSSKPVSDYRTITLTKHELITLEIGTPLKPPTTYFDWKGR